MAAKIQFRRGLEADRASVVADAGEPLWSSDTKKLHVGDGSTPGGIAVLMASLAGSIGLNVLAATTQAAARDAIGLGTSASPTFAGLTTTGAAAGDYVAGSFRNTNAGASAYTHLQFGNDGDQNQGYIYLCSSTNTGLAGAGSLNIGSNAALGLIAGGTVKATIAATGVATFQTGSLSLGTAGSNQVLIGGGQVSCPSGQGLYIGGTARFTGDGDYTHVRSADGSVKMYVANSASYHDNTSHNFRSADASVTAVTITATAATIYGSAPGTAAAGEVRIGGGQINAAGLIQSGTGIVATSASSDPGSAIAGQLYFNTSIGKLCVYTGSAWVAVH